MALEMKFMSKKQSKSPPKISKKTNNFKALGLRHPNNLPQFQQWKLEGDAEFLRKLSPEHQIWYASFLEAEFGNNPSCLKYDQKDAKRVYNQTDANERDALTQAKPRDRVSIEAKEQGLVRKPIQPEFPSKLQLREKVSIDVCSKGNQNHVENAMIETLDNHKASDVKAQQRRSKLKLLKS